MIQASRLAPGGWRTSTWGRTTKVPLGKEAKKEGTKGTVVIAVRTTADLVIAAAEYGETETGEAAAIVAREDKGAEGDHLAGEGPALSRRFKTFSAAETKSSCK